MAPARYEPVARSIGSNNSVGLSPRREYWCSLDMSRSAESRSYSVLNQWVFSQSAPISRAKLSCGRKRTLIPKRLFSVRFEYALCGWQISMMLTVAWFRLMGGAILT